MKRIEVIMSQSVDDDFRLLCGELGTGTMFTKIPVVLGQGYSIPKMGDSVWPQMNCMYIMYASKEESEKIITAVNQLRASYPKEGIACFVTKAKMK